MRSLDGLCPGCRFALEQFGHLGGRQETRFHAGLLGALKRLGGFHAALDVLREFLDDRCRRAGGHVQGHPGLQLEVGQTGLRHRGHLGQLRMTRFARHRQRLELARQHMAHHRRRGGDEHLHLTRQHVLNGLAGQVQVFITTPPSVMGHVLAGKLKALAVTGKIRHPQLPQVPTIAEAGLPSFSLESWVALYVANGTPPAVVQKLAAEVKRSMELPETRQRADQAGIEVRYLSPTDTTKLLDADIASWSVAIKQANIKLD